jgi:hypothetical protein
VVLGVYHALYVSAGYGNSGAGLYPDSSSSPIHALLAWLETIPVWLATTATLPIASFEMLIANIRLPLVLFSLIVVAVLVRFMGRRCIQEPHGRMFALGAVLSMLPLAATWPQERLRFFVSFGVYGLLGPWVARDFDVPERMRRFATRFVWQLHGVCLPLLFVPGLFSIANGPGVSAAVALDQALPRASMPITILLNPPVWIVPWFEVAMRRFRNEIAPPAFALYAGSQPLEIQRVDDRSLELHVAHSWFAAPFERLRDTDRAPFHPGDHIDLPSFEVEVREVDATGVPTRARFTFQHALEDPALAFRYWQGAKIMTWTPPPIGGRVQLTPTGSLF